jgi:hypothetical protein
MFTQRVENDNSLATSLTVTNQNQSTGVGYDSTRLAFLAADIVAAILAAASLRS